MNLFRVIYYSERNSAAALDLRQMLATCHKNNARDGLTGFLHFNGFYFLQALEGGRARVSSCYHRIAADNRHTNIVLISAEDVTTRMFPSWSMGLHEGMDNRAQEIFLRYFATSKVDPETINSHSLLDALQDIATELK
ncbi:MAG: BLUF domain-containing protein [Hyphomicrobium sp.]|nr:BLUF domain-containing protein [Hyphomicrobium sp.]